MFFTLLYFSFNHTPRVPPLLHVLVVLVVDGEDAPGGDGHRLGVVALPAEGAELVVAHPGLFFIFNFEKNYVTFIYFLWEMRCTSTSHPVQSSSSQILAQTPFFRRSDGRGHLFLRIIKKKVFSVDLAYPP